jgi:cation/acetate symporter
MIGIFLGPVLLSVLVRAGGPESYALFHGALVVGLVAAALLSWVVVRRLGYPPPVAFAVAASANLPAIIMLLFWKKTTAKGIAASIMVGVIVSLTLIAFSPELYALYGLNPKDAPFPLTNPGIVSIPVSFITLIVVSLLTKPKAKQLQA